MQLSRNSEIWKFRNCLDPKQIDNIKEFTDEDKVEGSNLQVHGNKIFINGEVGRFGVGAEEFVKALNSFPVGTKVIVVINSEGGNVKDGLQMYHAMLERREDVTTQVNSLAASIASTLMLGGDRRIISTDGQVMVHRTMTVMNGHFNRDDLAMRLELLDQMDATDVDTYASRLSIGKEQIRELVKGPYNGQGTFLNAKQALQAGFATEIKGLDENYERIQTMQEVYKVQLPEDVADKINKLQEEKDRRKKQIDNLKKLSELV